MKSKSIIFWYTGMSGSGKTTLSSYVKAKLESCDVSAVIIDGDSVRERYKTPKDFSRKDIEENNIFVARFAKDESHKYDVIIVSTICPIDKIRQRIRRMLSPNFYFIYLSADIESLRERDPKGLYKKADEGEITNLIGYSDENPYEIPQDADLVIDTSEEVGLDECQKRCWEFISGKL